MSDGGLSRLAGVGVGLVAATTLSVLLMVPLALLDPPGWLKSALVLGFIGAGGLVGARSNPRVSLSTTERRADGTLMATRTAAGLFGGFFAGLGALTAWPDLGPIALAAGSLLGIAGGALWGKDAIAAEARRVARLADTAPDDTLEPVDGRWADEERALRLEELRAEGHRPGRLGIVEEGAGGLSEADQPSAGGSR